MKDGEIHLWRADLDGNLSRLAALEPTLALEERGKARGFRFALHRHRYLLGRAALRSILARYVRAAPGELVFCYGPQGKPALAGGAVRFSVSHSHGLALYAISGGREVGVDVEQVRGGIDQEVAAQFCSRRALGFLQALPESARRRVFFQGWTRMEAYSKAWGVGLASGLEHLGVFLNRSDRLWLGAPDDRGKVSGWWFHEFEPRQGYVATLAAPGGKGRLRYWSWPAEATSQSEATCEVSISRGGG